MFDFKVSCFSLHIKTFEFFHSFYTTSFCDVIFYNYPPVASYDYDALMVTTALGI